MPITLSPPGGASRTARRDGSCVRWTSVLLLAVLAAAGAMLSGSPRPAAAQTEIFEGMTDVVEVQVPVNVIGRDGEPVRGLTAEDFQIRDRGDLRTIRGFEVVDLDVLVPGPETTTSDLEEAIPAAARRHFLLLFDLTFSDPASVIKARKAAQRFVLNELHPTDLVAVAVYTADVGPRLVVTFTPDRAQLARALDTLGAPRLLDRRSALDPLRFMIVDPERSSFSSPGSREADRGPQGAINLGADQSLQSYLRVIANEMEKAEKSFERGRIATWIGSLGEMAKMMAGIEGRKNVVLFSEGFDGRLMLGRGPDASDQAARQDRQAIASGQHWFVDTDDIYGNTALQNHATRMMTEFRRAGCVIQAVDISGLGDSSAEERRAHTTGQDALFFLANETGGTLFEDANDFDDQLASVLERSSVTYVLTFAADDIELDGSFHRLDVKLRDGAASRGIDIVHREGYYAPRPFEELHPMEKALLAADAIASAAPKREIEIDVLAAPFRATEEQAYVPVIIEIAGEGLIRGQESDQLSAEIYAYVSNQHGEMADFFTQVVGLELSDQGRESLAQTGLKYYGHLDLAPGKYLVRVLVRNSWTGRTGVRSVSLEVPEYEQASPQLLPPFFLEPPGQWVLVREPNRGDRETVVYPFTVNGSPYVPSAKPRVQPGEKMEVCLVAYNLGDGDVELEGTVLTEDGRELDAGRISLVERTVTGISRLDKVLARFEADDLESGTYTLQVALRQPAEGITQESSIPFTIRN
jgi:VWFA-related protein